MMEGVREPRARDVLKHLFTCRLVAYSIVSESSDSLMLLDEPVTHYSLDICLQLLIGNAYMLGL